MTDITSKKVVLGVTGGVAAYKAAELVRRLGALRLVGLASCVACVFCIGQFALLRPVSILLALDASVWWLSLVNATACTVVPVVRGATLPITAASAVSIDPRR